MKRQTKMMTEAQLDMIKLYVESREENKLLREKFHWLEKFILELLIKFFKNSSEVKNQKS